MMGWPCSQWQNMRKLLFCNRILLKRLPVSMMGCHAASGRICASCCSENMILSIKLIVSMMGWPCSKWQNMRKLLFWKYDSVNKTHSLHGGEPCSQWQNMRKLLFWKYDSVKKKSLVSRMGWPCSQWQNMRKLLFWKGIRLKRSLVSMMGWPCSQWQNMRKLLFWKGILLKKIPSLHDCKQYRKIVRLFFEKPSYSKNYQRN